MKITAKVRAVVVNRKGRVLMMTAKAPHVLQLPGGGVKPGEDLRKAIRREVAEETGYRKVVILRTADPVLCRRSRREVEVTVAFLVRVSKRTARTMTRRERARGLRVTAFTTIRSAIDALADGIRRYGRTAVRRDRGLIRALGLTRGTDLPALVEQLHAAA